MRAYREMPDEDLFTEQWVPVPLDAREIPRLQEPAASPARNAAKASTSTAFIDPRRPNPLPVLRSAATTLLAAAGREPHP